MMQISKLLLLYFLLFITIVYADATQTSMKQIDNSQQDFINNYLKEKQKQRVRRGETSATIEVSYESKNKKKQYKRGQRLHNATRELEDVKLENQRLRVESERLELENQTLQERQKKSSKVQKSYKKPSKKTKTKTKKYKRETAKYTKQKTYQKKKYRSKIYVKVDTLLKKMRIYRGSKLLYDWPIIMRESSVNKHSNYKGVESYRNNNYTQSYLRSQKKKPIYFNNVKDSKEKKANTLYSRIKLRQKHINILNDLMKKYGKSNVIIKMIR